MGLSWFFGEELALDLGTSNTLVYSKRKDGKSNGTVCCCC